MKGPAGVLRSSIAVKQWMGIRVGFHNLVEGFVNKWIVISFTEHIGYDPPVVQVKDGTQVELVYRNALIPFEFRHIGQPWGDCVP